jgi:ribosomal protein S18 acetylase RimI-like enzyme
VKIREFQYPDDLLQTLTLWRSIEKGVSLGPSDTPEEIKKKLLRDPELFLVAEEEGEIVGTVIGGFDGRRGLIYHLAVSSSFRGRGFGSRLMNEVETRLRTKGCIRCYLLVTKDNPGAMSYYKKLGWTHMDYVVNFGKNLV